MTPSPILLAEALVLMSWWAPVLLVALFGGWAWVVATIYDKDAARFYLPRRQWNLLHIGMGALALAAVIAPLPHFIVLPIVAGILAADLGIYFVSRNGDSRVPDSQKWSLDFSKMREASDAKKKGAAQSKLIFKGPKGELPVPPKDTPEYELRTDAERLVEKLIESRGSQLDIAPLKDNAYGAAALVDGVRVPFEPMPAARAIALIDIFKAAAGLDLQDRRRKLQGDFKLGPSGPGALTPVRVISLGSAAGMQMTLVLEPEKQVERKLDDLGLLPNQLEDTKALLEKKGVVLLTAPLDNGRTSTLYAFVRAHDAYTSNVQTIETEPQATIEGVRQNKFDPAVDGAEFSTTVRSILRRDPDVVAVAEMPDELTGKEVSRSDHDRTRVYLSLRIDGALAAMQAYAKAVGDQKAAAKGMQGVVAQRLARRLCENCRVAFQPTADMLRKLGLPADTKQLFKKGGQVLVKDKPVQCPICGGTGFFGQVGVFEVYTLDNDERQFFAENDISRLKAAFRTKKQQSIQSAALQHAINGTTSVEEVLRVTQPPESTPRPSSAGSAGSPPAAAPAAAAPKTATAQPIQNPPTKKA